MGAELFNNTTVENVEIAKTVAKLMGVSNFGDASNDWYNEIYGEGSAD